MKTILIAGSRQIAEAGLAYARRVVQRAHQLGYRIVVGDHPLGVDRAVVEECSRLGVETLVVGLAPRPRNGGCPHGRYRQMACPPGQTAAARYRERDRRMTDMADQGVFVWNGRSPGTQAGYDYMRASGKPAHLVTFPPQQTQPAANPGQVVLVTRPELDTKQPADVLYRIERIEGPWLHVALEDGPQPPGDWTPQLLLHRRGGGWRLP